MARVAPPPAFHDRDPSTPAWTDRSLLRALLVLSLPVMAENVLHMFVGFTDLYLAGHLKDEAQRTDATAAVGAVTYVIWLFGLIAGAIGAGSTAIIARASGRGTSRWPTASAANRSGPPPWSGAR